MASVVHTVEAHPSASPPSSAAAVGPGPLRPEAVALGGSGLRAEPGAIFSSAAGRLSQESELVSCLHIYFVFLLNPKLGPL